MGGKGETLIFVFPLRLLTVVWCEKPHLVLYASCVDHEHKGEIRKGHALSKVALKTRLRLARVHAPVALPQHVSPEA